MENIEKSEPQPKEVTLTIVLDEKGQVNVNGPLKNEAICIWLLEKAKDTIKAFNMQNPSKIVKPQGGIMNFVRGKR